MFGFFAVPSWALKAFCCVTMLTLGAIGCSSGRDGSAGASSRSSSNVSSSALSSSSSSQSESTSSSSSSQSVSSGPLVIPDPDPNATGGLALSEDKFLGNVIPSGREVRDDSGVYWNQVTPENAGKWGSVEAIRDQMDWGDLDRAYGYAKANGMPFKLHTLVWGSQEPGWVSDLTQQEQLAELQEWMTLLAERYPNVDMVEVVNEPQHAEPSFKAALGGDGASGWEWVLESFRLARQYFPNAELHLNDFDIISVNSFTENDDKMKGHMEIAELLKAEGLIDAVGVQCHAFTLNLLSADQVDTLLDRLSGVGLPIYISEMDVDDVEPHDQAAKYAELFPAFWEHPNVAGVTLWGYVEGQIWRDEFDAELILIDGTKKPAFIWLEEYFANRN